MAVPRTATRLNPVISRPAKGGINAVPSSNNSAPGITPDYGRSIGFVAGGIGDQIYHLTQLRALASASTDGRIDIACIHPVPIGKMLAGCRWVGDIIDARGWRRYRPGLGKSASITALASRKYDSAFFMHRSTSFKLVARAAKIPTRIGLTGSWLDRLMLNHALDNASGGERRALWGHRPFIAAIDDYILKMGLPLDDDTPPIIPTANAKKQAAAMIDGLVQKRKKPPVIIVNLFALDDNRRWPIDQAMSVIADIAARTGAIFLLNAGPDAADYHDAAMASWAALCQTRGDIGQHQLVDCLLHDPSMEKDVGLYHLADYYIGVDSFTANLALNCNLPAVVLFAKQGDILQYRSRITPIAAPIEGQIGSIAPDAIRAAFQGLYQPLPV